MEQAKSKVKMKAKQNSIDKIPGRNHHSSERVPVLKTYKLYIDGKFPRSESGRYYKLLNKRGELLANICRGSKKDFRNAVTAARKAQQAWSSRSAYNKGQILYRIAETLEGRTSQFCETLMAGGLMSKKEALKEVTTAVDRLVYFAGWCDKYQQIFSSVNPVESSYFNFSFPEPTGVVSAIASDKQGLLGVVSIMAPIIAGGNTTIILANDQFALSAVDLAEVLHTSDLPAGVVNLLTGYTNELHAPFSQHMDVNATVYCGNDPHVLNEIKSNASENVKRVVHYNTSNWYDESNTSPYMILDFQEIKTTWHPVGN